MRQTVGDLIHWHPHIHGLVREGVFLPEGRFVPLPRLASEPFLKLWEQEVFALRLGAGKISDEMAEMLALPGDAKAVGQSGGAGCRLAAGRRTMGWPTRRGGNRVGAKQLPLAPDCLPCCQVF